MFLLSCTPWPCQLSQHHINDQSTGDQLTQTAALSSLKSHRCTHVHWPFLAKDVLEPRFAFAEQRQHSSSAFRVYNCSKGASHASIPHCNSAWRLFSRIGPDTCIHRQLNTRPAVATYHDKDAMRCCTTRVCSPFAWALLVP